MLQMFTLAILVAGTTVTKAGVGPLAALPYALAPFGSSYTAHSINHALAAPVGVPAAAPLVAAPAVYAPQVAAPAVYAPQVAAPAVYAPHAAAYIAG
jgi:hypothetical protein